MELGPLVELNQNTKVLLPLPLSHIFGLEVFYACFIYGAPLLFNELSPQSFFVCAKKYAPEIICGVPSLYGAMLGLPPGMVDLSKSEVLLCGGAPLPLSMAEEFEKKYGKRLNNGYGSTESKIIALNINGPIESVGKIIPSVKVDIVDTQGNVLRPGETGEIRISGPCLMLGYLDNPQETAKVLSHSQYYTGDMGCIRDGYLFISGRNKEMIVVAGNKVFPAEVEDVLRQHPMVKEVAVIGIPNKQLARGKSDHRRPGRRTLRQARRRPRCLQGGSERINCPTARSLQTTIKARIAPHGLGLLSSQPATAENVQRQDRQKTVS